MDLNVSSQSFQLKETLGKTERLVIGSLFVILTIFTILGNILVLVAVKREKQLQTKFNIYVVNLAVTDLTVAATAMSFYTTDTILGYWPFGKFLCGLWIFNDYGMTFASVFTLIVISFDRFWAVTWPNHYKNNNTRKKCFLLITAVWVFMLVLWLPACIVDRINNAMDDNTCIWDPAANKEYVVVIAIFGHHGSMVFILFCYGHVFAALRKRSKVGPKSDKARSIFKIEPSTSNISPEREHKSENTNIKSINNESVSKANIFSIENMSRKGQPASSVESKRVTNREKKAFATMTYIIVGYIICWLPFHIVFDISAVKPEAVPNLVFQTTFWMTYMNSAINPFLYNFSNREFKRAFKNILFRN